MGISQKDIKLLWGRAANRCAMCRVVLTSNINTNSVSSLIGEQAHIVAEEENGPRGDSDLTIEERNSYHNLILLCPNHHALIDKNVDEYPVEKLFLIKSHHELWVEETLARDNARNNRDLIPIEDILIFMAEIRPLLRWLHRIVPREAAPDFLAHLQSFWHSYNIAHENIDDNLSGALDCLLRPLAAGAPDGEFILQQDPHYSGSKLYVAGSLFERFFNDKGLDWLGIHNTDTPFRILRDITFCLERVLRWQDRLSDIEVDIVQHALHILRYYDSYTTNKGYTEVSESLLDQFFELLKPFLSTTLGWRLPKKLDEDALYQIRIYCEE